MSQALVFLVGQRSADQLRWFHIVTLSTKLADQVLQNGYARDLDQEAAS
jgi:hypothetical protein